MVKTIRIYQCEWLGCGKVYNTMQKAHECQSQGSIGPDIEPGFTFDLDKSFSTRAGYSIVMCHMDHMRGHNKTYGLLEILGDLENPETIKLDYREIASYNLDRVNLLDEQEFGKITAIQEEILSKIKERFGHPEEHTSAVNNLYREHPYFQNKEKVEKK